MVNKVNSLLTPQNSALRSKLYFTVDLVEDIDMGTKWPRFPADYLDSRRDSIYDQIHQYDRSVSEGHEWLLNRGPWVSKDQLLDAIVEWVEEEPNSWRPLPEADAHINKQGRPTVDDLLEEYGNPFDDEYGNSPDDRRDDYTYRRQNDGHRDDYLDERNKRLTREGGYGGMAEYDDGRGPYDGRARYDAEHDSHDQRDDEYRSGSRYADEDDYYDDEDEEPPAAQQHNPIKLAPPRTSIVGLGQTMASRYEPGLRSHIPKKQTKDTSKHRTYDFFESFCKPDSPWANTDPNARIDPGPEAPPERRQPKPPRPVRPNMPKAYPVAEDPSQDLDAHLGPKDVGGKKGDVGDYWDLGEPDDMPHEGANKQVEEEDPEERARREKELNDNDWEIFMQQVKQGG